jgi:hypothetical protein
MSENTHEQIATLMMDCLSGRMSDAERQRFKSLLQDHPEYSQELLELEHMMALCEQHHQQPVPEPSANMDAGFYGMLNEQLAAEQAAVRATARPQQRWDWLSSRLRPLGYALSLLAVGGLIGHNWQLSSERDQLLAEQSMLRDQQVQALTVLAMLDMPSANKRLMAINLAAMNQQPSESLMDAMLTTLKQDNNINVRLEALDTLTSWMDRQDNAYLRDGLVAAIDHQQSPMVQIALADLLLRIGERQAVEPLRKLLEQEPLIEPVRNKLNDTINQLI